MKLLKETKGNLISMDDINTLDLNSLVVDVLVSANIKKVQLVVSSNKDMINFELVGDNVSGSVFIAYVDKKPTINIVLENSKGNIKYLDTITNTISPMFKRVVFSGNYKTLESFILGEQVNLHKKVDLNTVKNIMRSLNINFEAYVA